MISASMPSALTLEPAMAPIAQPPLPSVQTQLLLHQPRSPYETFSGGGVPELRPGELLVQVEAIGLNPIDWKSADFGFALPQLPCLNGREFVGKIVSANVPTGCRLAIGDQVLAVATDYRDFRKSAFQEYAVVCCFNAIKIPKGIDPYEAASLGVAFVTAALSLGICLGVTLPKQGKLPDLDLLKTAQSLGQERVPSDCYDEVFVPIPQESRPRRGEWVLIYGASSVTAQLCIQLAKAAGLRVIGVASVRKHARRLTDLGVDILVDRTDLDLAAEQVHLHTQGNLRFAMDMIGKETSAWCQAVLATSSSHQPTSLKPNTPSPINENPTQKTSPERHLVCLASSPKIREPGVRVHQVPVKLFHESEDLGCVLSYWLYHSLKSGAVKLPEAQVVDGGLEVVNSCLELMRRGEISGSRLVVKLR